jgi:ubiquinone/menaquinone biosynthesis C-methylase UbiE
VTDEAQQGYLSRWRANLVRDLPGKVLEIGVGSGANLAYYRQAEHVWAIEPNEASAERARAAAQLAAVPVTVDVVPAERLPYPDAAFDHVVSSLVFCSVEDPRAALREVGRVLRPGGVLHMVEHVRPANPLFALPLQAATPLWSRIAHNCHLDRPTVDLLRAEGWGVTVHARRLIFVRLSATPPTPQPNPQPTVC